MQHVQHDTHSSDLMWNSTDDGQKGSGCRKNKLIDSLLWDLPSYSCWCLRVAGLPGNIWISRGWEYPKRLGSTVHVMLQVPGSGLSGCQVRTVFQHSRYKGTAQGGCPAPGEPGTGHLTPDRSPPTTLEPPFAEPSPPDDSRPPSSRPEWWTRSLLVDARRLCPPVTYFCVC